MEIRFLSLKDVLWQHKRQINFFGGQHGIRSIELLESAMAQPEAMSGGEYLHNGIFEMAAAYLYHLVQNHAFFDGNKRIGAAAATVFLDLNGYELDVSADSFEALVLGVACGEIKKTAIREYLELHSRQKL